VPADTLCSRCAAGNHAGLALGAYLVDSRPPLHGHRGNDRSIDDDCNEIVMPCCCDPIASGGFPAGLSGLIKMVRRVAIVVIIALAYGYFRLFTGPGTLRRFGLLSFAAVAQLRPASSRRRVERRALIAAW